MARYNLRLGADEVVKRVVPIVDHVLRRASVRGIDGRVIGGINVAHRQHIRFLEIDKNVAIGVRRLGRRHNLDVLAVELQVNRFGKRNHG